jgi:oxygen-independent coproporphyrinogen III oxidase
MVPRLRGDSCGIYIHIPFCDTKCIYCDFYSITNHSRKDEFLESLKKEIQNQSALVKDKSFDTIFFGGGTPSLLSYSEFNSIFDSLYSNYNISENSEITIEANPGTIDQTKFKEFKKLPINRISFGVQSFIDSELNFLTRIHSSSQAIETIKTAQDSGFENINLDLIFALPNQSLENWKYNLEMAISLATKHISAYSLIFEVGTFLNMLLHKNRVRKADIDLEQEMYEFTMSYLPENGFGQYEISNYAKAGYQCRHNLKYWEYDDYLSFGPSASSFVNNKRWTNTRDINKYIDLIDNNQVAADFTEEIDKETSITEYIFLGLRSKGIDIKKYDKKYNESFKDKYKDTLEILLKSGFGEMNNSHFSMTRKGYALCDEIVATYF